MQRRRDFHETIKQSEPVVTQGRKAMELRGKKVIVLGERDGVQGGALTECLKAAGAEVVLKLNQCFV
jgi:glycine reductase